MIQNEPSGQSGFKTLLDASLLSVFVGIYIAAFYLEISDRLGFFKAIRFEYTFGALVTVLCFFSIFVGKDPKQTKTPLVGLTIFFLFWLGLYALFSYDPETSRNIYSDRVLKFSLVALFIYAATKKTNDLKMIVILMMLAWLKIGFEGFHGWATGSMMWENQGVQRLHGSTTNTGHPNSFSGFAVGCLPFCIFLYKVTLSRVAKYALAVMFIFSLMIILFTGSRTGYVAVGLGVIFYFFKSGVSRLKLMAIFFIGVIALGIFSPEDYKERFASIFTGKDAEGNSTGKRKQIIEDALKISAMYPMGVGLQAFPKIRGREFGRRQDTHNLYLEVLTNVGPIGLIIFLTLVSKIININRRNLAMLGQVLPLLNGQARRDAIFLQGMAKAVLGFLILRLFLGLFGMDLYEIYWWLALGFTLAINKLSQKIKQQNC